jgi:Na+:H+ antiporter, NhaA family
LTLALAARFALAMERVIDDSQASLRPTWRESERFVPRAFVRPVLRFMELETASGLVMLVGAIVALVWANSPWHAAYEQIWNTPIGLQVGKLVDLSDMDLHGWVNDGAMALFFLLAGLEIKRQLLRGELRDRRAAALPALAALGGMIVPALIYVLVNHGHAGAKGWGIPVATDIAFAVGVVTLAGRRVPLGAKIFLLTLAVVDDVGGIVVIAIFYATDVKLAWLAVAAAAIVVTVLLRRNDVRSLVPYIVLGTLCWLSFHQAGVEAAIVGVIFGLLTPIVPFHDPATFGPTARTLVDRIDRSYADGELTDDERDDDEIAFEDLARYASETASPLERIEGRLALWVSLLIVPVFAFANAGVRIETDALDGRIALGVALGLVPGKTIGVFTFSFLAVKIGIGRLPNGTTWRHAFGLAVTAGIGFTVALFVATISFTDAARLSSAKIGVLGASVVAGVLGLLLLRSSPPAIDAEA